MKISKIAVSIYVLLLGVGVAITPVVPVSAVNITAQTCDLDPYGAICQGSGDSITPIINTVVDILLFILGIIAIVMIVIGGFRYTLSGGDSKAVTDAKNTILYAVIGLVVAFSAYAVVHWVVKLLP